MGDRLSCLQRGVSRPSAFRQNREMGVGLDIALQQVSSHILQDDCIHLAEFVVIKSKALELASCR